jgi:lactose/L-arabinose transport system ATP-binding protein
VRGPDVFLFDEPLSNLDAELRVEMRVEIARLHNEIGATMIYVTHDQVEAMTLADKIVVLRAGRIEQVGKPLDLYNDPDNRFVAGFIGSPAMNFFEGQNEGGRSPSRRLAGRRSPAPSLLRTGRSPWGLRPNQLGSPGATATGRSVGTSGRCELSLPHAPDGARIIVEAHDQIAPAPGSRTGLTFDAGTRCSSTRRPRTRLR